MPTAFPAVSKCTLNTIDKGKAKTLLIECSFINMSN